METARHSAQEGYNSEELESVLELVDALKSIRQELLDEGIPLDELEELFITKELR